MSASEGSFAKKIVSSVFRGLARVYVKIHKPKVVAVAGSVGKTSTKLMLAKLLESEMKVSYMDDSYNNGLGLYLSVFQIKVPSSSIGWPSRLLLAIWRMFTMNCDILIVEYGIDGMGDMDELVAFLKPDVAILTAVTPEHMEFLKTIDNVGVEETKILRAVDDFGVVNAVDVDKKYLDNIDKKLFKFGWLDCDAYYEIESVDRSGASVKFYIEDDTISTSGIKIISEPLVRQLSGAMLLARKLGASIAGIKSALPALRPAASRMSLLEGVNDSVVLDDSANFSPVAGVAALKTLKSMDANRFIAVLGNMHELGDFADEGYRQVAEEFKGLDMIVLVGDMSVDRFGSLARKAGFVEGENLFMKDTSLDTGRWLRDEILKDGDVVLVKGPFGGWYLEEVVRLILNNPKDAKYITRQSDFWYAKKLAHFGDTYNLDGPIS